jgi:tRNA(fMet)-specific endonuclease VapC
MIEPRFLLDTNILVYLVGGASPHLRDRVEEHEPGRVVTSTLCVAEAMYGIAANSQTASLDALLRVIVPLPFDLAAAERFPDVPFRLGKLDRFIAAHTLSLDLTLVTNNERDFADIPGLSVENWTR